MSLTSSATLGERLFSVMPQHADENGCRNWTRSKNTSGYGHLTHKGKILKAHRISWEIYNQRVIPDGMYILHSCDNPGCINPEHLSLGTHADNMRERAERGRHPSAKFTRDEVVKIRQIAASGIPCSEIARQLGVAHSTIRCMVNRTAWRHVS